MQVLKPQHLKEYCTIIKLRENGRNIVGQQLPTLLDATCCVSLHTLLHFRMLLRKV